MHAPARRVDETEILCFAIALLNQIDGFSDIDDIGNVLRRSNSTS
jgi:hypothetical protein